MGCLHSKNSGDKKNVKSINLQNKKTEFRYDDGRRFYGIKDAIYHLPNDEDEQDRLHLQHFLIRYLFQSNFSSPIEHILDKPGTKILDIGCGPGSWSFDIATTYPFVEVIGLDMSPHQPSYIKPKNFTFIKANVLEGLPFEDNTFDFVFQRCMIFGYPNEEWPNVMNELVRVLKPGGYLELCEPSPVFNMGPTSQRIWEAGT
ncbi:7247_t:CDS:2, partial [Cetraspora pellucida]